MNYISTESTEAYILKHHQTNDSHHYNNYGTIWQSFPNWFRNGALLPGSTTFSFDSPRRKQTPEQIQKTHTQTVYGSFLAPRRSTWLPYCAQHRLPTVGGFTFVLVRWRLLRWLPTLGLIIPSISVLFYAFFFSPIAICIFEENCRVHSWGKLFVCRKNEKTLIGELIEAAQQCLCSKVEGSFYRLGKGEMGFSPCTRITPPGKLSILFTLVKVHVFKWATNGTWGCEHNPLSANLCFTCQKMYVALVRIALRYNLRISSFNLHSQLISNSVRF